MKTKHILPIALLAGLLLGDNLHAQILVLNGSTDVQVIGEYNLDGSTVKASLVTGLSNSIAIAVSGSDIFVANPTTNRIGEYTISGSVVNASLISGLNIPTAIAVSGSDIFVLNRGDTNNIGTIGEYTTSGSTVHASLVSKLNLPGSIAVSGSDIFVAGLGDASTTIGEYTTSGGTVNASLVSGLVPEGIAVSGSDIFVVNFGSNSNGTIGEYTTSGSTVNASLVSGLNEPSGIAVSGSDIFIGIIGGTIGEYTTSGSTVNAALVTGLGVPYDLAVTGSPSAPSSVTPTNQTTPVSSGSSYANTIAPIIGIGGYGTKAAILGGTASVSCSVTMAFNGSVNYSNIASDVLTVSGMPNKGTTPGGATKTDQFVLELSYDNNAANQLGGADALELLWLNPNTNLWENAIFGNSDQAAGASTETQSEMFAAYNPSTDDNLSWYGVDTTDGYVWAVLDHNSNFGAGNPNIQPIPEPSTWVLLGIGGACFFIAARRRGQSVKEKV